MRGRTRQYDAYRDAKDYALMCAMLRDTALSDVRTCTIH
jgi:hypothetical protein